MKVSAIIASYRPGKCLYRCIRSLNEQTVLPDEIIIGVDSFDTYKVLTDKKSEVPISVGVSGTTGVSAARNSASKWATGDVLAFIDDDAYAQRKWVEEIHKTFQDPSVSCAGGKVIPVFERRSIPEHWYWIIGCTGRSTRPIGSNMAIRKTDFDECGKFTENLGRIKKTLNIGEETELVLKLESRNKKVVWNPEMVVNHWCPDRRLDWTYILSRAYKEGTGKKIISKTYPMKTEKQFLSYYLTHPDRYTVPVLMATGLGFILAW